MTSSEKWMVERFKNRIGNIKGRMDEYEQSLHNDAEEYIKKGDYYMQMSGE